MGISIGYVEDLSKDKATIFLATKESDFSGFERLSIEQKIQNKDTGIEIIYSNPESHYIVLLKKGAELDNDYRETVRGLGKKLASILSEENINEVQISSLLDKPDFTFEVLEGLYLGSYSFDKYKTESPERLKHISLSHKGLKKESVEEYKNVLEAVWKARDLINEPVSYLTAEKLSEEIKKSGTEAGFSVEVFDKSKIQALKMGGLLGVNQGSPLPPTFNVLEFKPDAPLNKNPIVLVGKGVVFDTGGLSLKTPEGMEFMKADMGGAAVVVSTLFAVAKNKLPLHIIGLIPATDNRPGGNALAPGDVITMHSGKTVEVLNTDAEGRLILADALSFAEKYEPELVIDLATLTGSAMRTLGKEAMAMMGTANKQVKDLLQQTGFDVHERVVELPLWKEYGEQLKSDIADIKNVGSPVAGAITAGKFLEFFTKSPWMHLDIAGVAYLTSPDSYRNKNGTGVGVRLMYNFLKTLSRK